MSDRQLHPIWTPADTRAIWERAADFPTVEAAPAAHADDVNIFTGQVLQ